MTIRAGSYSASKPRPRGVLRNDGQAQYVCVHNHGDYTEAKRCAAGALREIKKADPFNEGLHTEQLPNGWQVFEPAFHTKL